jgi:HAD superfamily hydrolase (TIGR01549 family)
LDGTLYTVSWLKLFMTLGLLGDIKRLRSLFPARAHLRDRQPFEDEMALKKALSEELAKRAGGTPEEALSWYEERFMQRFKTVLAKRGQVREGLIPLLERLRARGLRLAVVSDFGLVPERLEALGIPTDLFDEAFGVERFGALKPTAKAFHLLAEKWQVLPEEILMVGDRLDSDAGSAELAGLKFLGISGSRAGGPDFVDWSDAAAMIEGRLNPR